MRTFAFAFAVFVASSSIVACRAGAPAGAGAGAPAGAGASAGASAPAVASASAVASAVASAGAGGGFGYAQLGQGCSPTDGLADVYVFTRVDRGCAARDGDEVLVVTYWGERRARGSIRITSGEHGQAETCVQERGGCVALSEVELTGLDTGAPHLRARLGDGRVVESDFVLRECPEHKQLCG